MVRDQFDQRDGDQQQDDEGDEHVRLDEAGVTAAGDQRGGDGHGHDGSRLPEHPAQPGDRGDLVRRQLQARVVGGGHRQAHAAPGERGADGQPRVRRESRGQRHHRQPAREDEEAADHGQAVAGLAQCHRGDARDGDHADGPGGEQGAGAERRDVVAVLRVQRHERGEPEGGRAVHQVDQVHDPETPAAQQPVRHERRGVTARVPDEQAERDDGDCLRPQEDRAVKRDVAAAQVGDAEHRRRDADGEQDDAADVDSADGPPRGCGDELGREGDENEADGHVHEEDAAPGPVTDEYAADDGPDDAADWQDGGEHADGAVAFGSEVVRHDSGRGRHERAAAECLDETRQEQEDHAVGEPAAERGQSEDSRRDTEDGLAPVHVADLACHRHGDDLAERVDRDRPAAPVDPGPQVVLDGRQGGRHDGLIDRRHEQADGDDGEHQPAPVQRFRRAVRIRRTFFSYAHV
jgi:hypothetical protein